MKSEEITIPKMACGNCFNTVKNVLGRVNGVKSIACNLEKKSIMVEYDDAIVKAGEIHSKLQKTGFPGVER